MKVKTEDLFKKTFKQIEGEVPKKICCYILKGKNYNLNKHSKNKMFFIINNHATAEHKNMRN